MDKPHSSPSSRNILAPTGPKPSGTPYPALSADTFPPRELSWREPPKPHKLPSGSDAMIRISCWRKVDSTEPLEFSSSKEDDYHVVTMLKKETRAELLIDERSVWKGGRSGQLLITGPRRGGWRKIITPPYEHLRVYLPQKLIAECFEEVMGSEPPKLISLCSATTTTDIRTLQLLVSIFQANVHSVGSLPFIIESLGINLGARLVTCLWGESLPNSNIRQSASENLCIQRTLEYINDNLCTSITLTELSKVYGASRCRFMERFKKYTGYTPHAYILHRKILRAKEMLMHPKYPIIEVALGLGFNSQPHFTSVFRRVVGVTPARWRQENK